MYWLRWHYHVKDIPRAPYKIKKKSKQKRQNRRQSVVAGRQQLYCVILWGIQIRRFSVKSPAYRPPRMSQMFLPREKLFPMKKLSPVKFMFAAAAATTTPAKNSPKIFTVVKFVCAVMRDLLAVARFLIIFKPKLAIARLRLHASTMSICLSVCLSVCRQNAKKNIF